MDLATLRSFFLWCTIINAALLGISFLVCAFAGDFAYRMHSRWFPMSREAFTVAMYSFLGAYKILFHVFNVVPLIALFLV